jgi:hypothetical protein
LTANTWGYGATTEYVGRVKQDAAFLDRFIPFTWEIDEQLELATCSSKEWCKRVQGIRARVKAKGLKVLVTPRASYKGASLLEVGFTFTEIENMLFSAMSKEQWEMVK